MAGRKFAPSSSTCRLPHHPHRLLHPLFGLPCRHHARAVWSSGGVHLLLHGAVSQRPGPWSQRRPDSSGTRRARDLASGKTEKGEAPGSYLWTDPGVPDLSKRRRREDRKRCVSALVHAPFLRSGENLCSKKRLCFQESTQHRRRAPAGGLAQVDEDTVSW